MTGLTVANVADLFTLMLPTIKRFSTNVITRPIVSSTDNFLLVVSAVALLLCDYLARLALSLMTFILTVMFCAV